MSTKKTDKSPHESTISDKSPTDEARRVPLTQLIDRISVQN